MSDECIEIKILKEIPFFGEGDSLANRLRNVKLKGFPEVKIYKNAQFETEFLKPEEINARIHTPQPSVYQNELAKVDRIAKLFKAQGINILNLEKAYDFAAKSSSGKVTEWTMIPPVIEEWHIPKTAEGKLNYEPLIGPALRENLQAQSLGINPELMKLNHTSPSEIFQLINDGTHRVHYGYLNGGLRILKIKGMTPGYPYYAAPQKYDSVKIMPEPSPETTAMKIHIVESPGQKALYRLFPSGGIMTGDVRPATKGEVFH